MEIPSTVSYSDLTSSKTLQAMKYRQNKMRRSVLPTIGTYTGICSMLHSIPGDSCVLGMHGNLSLVA